MAKADAKTVRHASDWETVRLADVAELVSGGTPSKTCAAYWDGPIPWASPKDLKRPYLSDAEDHISERGAAEGSRIVPPGSVFVVIRGMILAKDIPVAMTLVPMAFNQDMKAIIPSDRIDSQFLLFAVRAFKESLVPDIGVAAHGTRRILTSAIEDFQVPIPPLWEQRAIAKVLGTIYQAIAAQKAIIDRTTELKAALMAKLFTEGIRSEPAKETDLGPLPASWDVSTLGELIANGCGEIQTGPFGSQLHASDYQTSGVPIVNPTHLSMNSIVAEHVPRISEKDAARLARHVLQIGDILIARRGEFSRYACITPQYAGWLCGTGCMRIRLKSSQINNSFLGLTFSTELVQRYLRDKAVGSIMPNLNGNILSRLPVIVPPIDDQVAMVCAFQGIDARLIQAVKERTLYAELFQAMLEQLMTGRIRVNELDLAEIVRVN